MNCPGSEAVALAVASLVGGSLLTHAWHRKRLRESDPVGKPLPGMYNAVRSATQSTDPVLTQLTIAEPAERWFTHRHDDDSSVIFVRKIYDKMYTTVAKARQNTGSGSLGHVLFIGNPGIGKTWALNYLLYKALNKPDHGLVMLRTSDAVFAFTPQGQCYQFDRYPGEDWVRAHGADKANRGLLLYDVEGTGGQTMDNNTDFGPVCVAVAASPCKAQWRLFQKQMQPVEFYVPLWEEAEFVKRHHGNPMAKAEFENFGGVLRGAFEKSREILRYNAIQSFDCSNATSGLLNVADSHQIVQLKPVPPAFGRYVVAFLSDKTRDLFWEAKWTAAEYELTRCLYTMLSAPPHRELYGKPFEKYVHKFAARLSFPQMKLLCTTGGPTASSELAALKPRNDFVQQLYDDVKVLAAVKDALPKKKGRWIVPKASNFPVFDAFLAVNKKLYAVHVSISDEHAPTASEVNALEDRGFVAGSTASTTNTVQVDAIIWVVDQFRNPDLSVRQDIAGKAPWNNLPQYRVVVSCTEHGKVK